MLKLKEREWKEELFFFKLNTTSPEVSFTK